MDNEQTLPEGAGWDQLSRRLELLRLEGLGFSQAEIVRELSQKFGCSKRQVYSDFETREVWQPILQNSSTREQTMSKAINRYEQIYRQASIKFLTTSQDTAKLKALNVMLKTNGLLLETAVLPAVLDRLKALEQKVARGVFVP
jgi:hypothetical protein